MTNVNLRPRLARTLAATALAAGLALAALPSAQAAPPAGFIATPNGMVGLSQTITIYAPSVTGQVVTIGLQLGAEATTVQTTIGTNGYGAAIWTPTSAGAWTLNALGSALSSGSTTITVAPMPTYTVLLAQNNLQSGVTDNLTGAVVAPIGTIAPTGSIQLTTSTGAVIVTSPLTGQYGTSTATAILPWIPTTPGVNSLYATFQPASGSQLASTSPLAQPAVIGAVQNLALRFPPNLYVGSPTVLQAVIGNGLPAGSAAFSLDGKGISGSIATINGVSSFPWTPTVTGVHTITANYSSSATGPSGTSTQTVNIQGARTVDVITVDPPAQPVWSIAQPIVMTAGTSVTLAGTSQSGTTVVFSEQGPCVINGVALQALAAGQCQVTVVSPGNSALSPGNATYTVTVQAAPKGARR